MEAFSLLKYWKSTVNGNGNGNGSGSGRGRDSGVVIEKLQATPAAVTPTTIITPVNRNGVENNNDDGPFFDFEFPVPDDEIREKIEGRQNSNENDSDQDKECFNEIQVDDDIEDIIRSAAAVANSKPGQFPVRLAKSATKVRVFMSGLKRSKSESKQIHLESKCKSKCESKSSKFMRVKVPIISLLTRAPSNAMKNTQENEVNEEKEVKKEVVQRYLKLVRPLYVKVSNKNNRETTEKDVKRLNFKKYLGKSKSAIVHSISRNTNTNTMSFKKKKGDDNDWILEQQDGIQGAILHCKRSFNSSSSSSEGGGDETMSVLVRSTSDQSHEEKVAAEVEVAGEE